MQRRWSKVIVMMIAFLGTTGAVPAEAESEASTATPTICPATTMGEFGVVGHCQNRVVEFGLDLPHTMVMTHEQEGTRFVGDAGIYQAGLRLGGGFRPGSEDFQLFGEMSLHGQYLSEASGFEPGPLRSSRHSFHLGEMKIGARSTVIHDLRTGMRSGIRASYHPFLDLYAEVGLRVGQMISNRDDDRMTSMGAQTSYRASEWFDVGGHGAGRIGARAAKYVTYRDVLTADLALASPLPEALVGRQYTPRGLGSVGMGGLKPKVGLSYRRIHNRDWSTGFATDLRTLHALRDEPGRFLAYRVDAHGLASHSLSYPNWELTGKAGVRWTDFAGIESTQLFPESILEVSVLLSVKRNFL